MRRFSSLVQIVITAIASLPICLLAVLSTRFARNWSLKCDASVDVPMAHLFAVVKQLDPYWRCSNKTMSNPSHRCFIVTYFTQRAWNTPTRSRTVGLQVTPTLGGSVEQSHTPTWKSPRCFTALELSFLCRWLHVMFTFF